MSMFAQRPGAGRDDVGEKIASFPTYEQAQKTVSSLIAGEVPARDIAIVGSGLRSIERITGKLGYATAARSGALNGLMLGLLFAFIFVLGTPTVQISAFVGVLLVGMALGMLLSLGTYSIVRRRRDFASVMQVAADHYDVCVAAGSAHKARGIVGPTGAQRTVVSRPAPDDAAPPRYGERVAPGTEAPAAAPRPPVTAPVGEAGPPQYGERVSPRGDAPAAPPRPPAPTASPASSPAPTGEEPPRYGERVTPAPRGDEDADGDPAPPTR
ncbi:general stress protein [uncultured Microbacterium sp.]|uniref:general stress protein n=1 Tax=uncultured Microbacterium sp. TaxID=191216 RepID=UPI0028D5947B|nr:general stress protein [uncultured Microbacterium sp.]